MPFERFRGQIERERFGVVITAHPSLSLARALQEVLVELALNSRGDGSPDGDAPRRRPLDRVSSLRASTAPISRSTWTRSIANPCTPSSICTAR